MAERRAASGSQSELREANRTVIIEAIRRFGRVTQVELVEITGLSPATISTIVKELVGNGIVDTSSTVRSGRRAQAVTLARRVGLVGGVHVATRSMRVVLGDFSHTILAEQVLPLPNDHRPDTSLDRAVLLLSDRLEQIGATLDELVAVGVGVPAPVDPVTGAISSRGIMRGWDEESLTITLQRRLGCAVYADNEANLGMLAESVMGEAQGASTALYVRIEHGVGAGLLIAGSVHRGFGGTAGEIGHIQVNPQGDICRCGHRGCLDTVVGTRALLSPLRESHGGLTLSDVIRLAGDGDPGCARVLADAGTAIGTVVAGVGASVAPEIVVVGGELAEAGDVLLRPMEEALHEHLLAHAHGSLRVVAGGLGLFTEAIGAMLFALQSSDISSRARGRAEPVGVSAGGSGEA